MNNRLLAIAVLIQGVSIIISCTALLIVISIVSGAR